MWRNKLLRFLIVSFGLGAFLGLISGLAFGGSDHETAQVVATAEAADSAGSSAQTGSDGSSSEPMTPEHARAIGANEMGQVLVLMYHLIDTEETKLTRTPENFRNDIALLKSEGFYPINVRDLVSGNIDIPAGTSPVAITFDDSSPGQYRILDDGTVDPKSAVGIMQAAVEAGGWASRGTFACLLDVVPKERVIFGQPDRQREKLHNLVDWGYEVASHTVTHLNLKKASTNEAVKQLAQSKSMLEDLIGGGYTVTSIAIPYGEYPADVGILARGEYEGTTYGYTAALALGDTPSPSPFSVKFDPLHIPRITGTADYLPKAIQRFKDRPELRYISDGDPWTVSAPAQLADELGDLADDLGRPVVRY
ncbi:MAG: polysaccharide deacetylase family protein [Thermoleophilia bacterium]|jgi:peptidoglycan/xylan/chitin deacetylase (PgdA/CDA1 family)